MISQTSTCEYPIASGFALDARWARNRLQKPWPASCPYNPDVYIDLDHEARGLKHHGASTTKGKASDNSGKKDNNKKPNIEKKKKKKTPIDQYLESLHPNLPEDSWLSFTKKWKFTDNKDETAPGEHVL